MTNPMTKVMRKISPWLAAGVLLQAGSCSVDTTTLATGLVQSLANALISDLIFGLFNVGAF